MCVIGLCVEQERGEIIAEHWLDKGRAPTFAEVASEEYLLFPPTHEEGALPLQIRPLSFAVHRCVQTFASRDITDGLACRPNTGFGLSGTVSGCVRRLAVACCLRYLIPHFDDACASSNRACRQRSPFLGTFVAWYCGRTGRTSI